jgi:hypothetical protein
VISGCALDVTIVISTDMCAASAAGIVE